MTQEQLEAIFLKQDPEYEDVYFTYSKGSTWDSTTYKVFKKLSDNTYWRIKYARKYDNSYESFEMEQVTLETKMVTNYKPIN